METLRALARDLEFSHITIEQFRSRAIALISSMSVDDLMSVALYLNDWQLDECDMHELTKQ
jgi:hypothetical protein